jgi:hypothetical protein
VIRRAATPVLLVVGIAAVVVYWGPIRFWIAYHTGSLNTSGAPPNYNFWSGFGSDLTEVTLLGAIAGFYWKHNCHHEKGWLPWGCWRIGKHLVDGTPWCNKHHEALRCLLGPYRSPRLLMRQSDLLHVRLQLDLPVY